MRPLCYGIIFWSLIFSFRFSYLCYVWDLWMAKFASIKMMGSFLIFCLDWDFLQMMRFPIITMSYHSLHLAFVFSLLVFNTLQWKNVQVLCWSGYFWNIFSQIPSIVSSHYPCLCVLFLFYYWDFWMVKSQAFWWDIPPRPNGQNSKHYDESSFFLMPPFISSSRHPSVKKFKTLWWASILVCAFFFTVIGIVKNSGHVCGSIFFLWTSWAISKLKIHSE